MGDNTKASWEKILHPKTLKANIITASIFIAAFEMLKSSVIEKIESFFTHGFNETGRIVSPK